MTPSTPLEVLEEIRNTSTNAAEKIEEAEALCAKVVKQISQTWEDLIDDEELEKLQNSCALLRQR